MKNSEKSGFDKSVYNTIVFKSYKIMKKIAKYSFYVALGYFAYEGFMLWD